MVKPTSILEGLGAFLKEQRLKKAGASPEPLRSLLFTT